MDARVKKAVLGKMSETISNVNEIARIQNKVGRLSINPSDFAFGIAVGRIYNSFYYQTRRTLKRDPTEDEFLDFLDILTAKAGDIQNAIKQR